MPPSGRRPSRRPSRGSSPSRMSARRPLSQLSSSHSRRTIRMPLRMTIPSPCKCATHYAASAFVSDSRTSWATSDRAELTSPSSAPPQRFRQSLSVSFSVYVPPGPLPAPSLPFLDRPACSRQHPRRGALTTVRVPFEGQLISNRSTGLRKLTAQDLGRGAASRGDGVDADNADRAERHSRRNPD